MAAFINPTVLMVASEIKLGDVLDLGTLGEGRVVHVTRQVRARRVTLRVRVRDMAPLALTFPESRVVELVHPENVEG